MAANTVPKSLPVMEALVYMHTTLKTLTVGDGAVNCPAQVQIAPGARLVIQLGKVSVLFPLSVADHKL